MHVLVAIAAKCQTLDFKENWLSNAVIWNGDDLFWQNGFINDK